MVLNNNDGVKQRCLASFARGGTSFRLEGRRFQSSSGLALYAQHKAPLFRKVRGLFDACRRQLVGT